MVYADANVFLRFILNDNKEMADYAETLLNNHEAFLLHEVIAEMVYVLNSVYNIKRKDISNELTKLLAYTETDDKAVIIQALKDETDADKERLEYLQSLNILLTQAVKELKHDLGEV